MKVSKPGAITIFAGAGLTFLGAILPFYSIGGFISVSLLQTIWGWLNIIYAGAAVFFALKGTKMSATIVSGAAGLLVVINFFINSGGASSIKGAGYFMTLLGGLALIAGGVVFFLTGVDNGEGFDPFSKFINNGQFANMGQSQASNQMQNPGQYQDPAQYQDPGQYQNPNQNQ